MEINPQKLLRLENIPLLLLGICLLAFFSCGPTKENSDPSTPKGTAESGLPEETATRGNISIGVDETLRPIGRQIVDAFENMYPDASFDVHYLPEPALFTELIQDSLRLILACRDLTDGESRTIWKDQVKPKVDVLGKTAMTMIIHPDNAHDSLLYDDLGRIVRGEVTDWSELGTGMSGPIELVYDDPQSAAARDLQERFLSEGQKVKARAYAAKGTEAVIDYVADNPAAVGFVGYAWISDRDSPRVKGYFDRVKLMRLEAPDSSDIAGAFVRPYQNEIALDRYPLTHKMYALSREYFSGLGTGFVVFAAGEHGQRIILKSGMYPEFPPPRLVVFPED